MSTAIKRIAAASATVAALMAAVDYARKTTGWGFVIFVASSIGWMAGALLSKDAALGTQNIVLFAINILGVYRYLIRKKDG